MHDLEEILSLTNGKMIPFTLERIDEGEVGGVFGLCGSCLDFCLLCRKIGCLRSVGLVFQTSTSRMEK